MIIIGVDYHPSFQQIAHCQCGDGQKLGVRLYWMWRNGWDYSQLVEFGSHAGRLVTGHGVK